MIRTMRGMAGGVLGSAGLLVVLGGAAVLIFQAYAWLRTGAWLPIPLGAGVVAIWRDVPQAAGSGAESLLEMVLNVPLALALAVLGGGAIAAAVKVAHG